MPGSAFPTVCAAAPAVRLGDLEAASISSCGPYGAQSGGDFCSMLVLPAGLLAVALVDVQGHGSAAALHVPELSSLVVSSLLRCPDPGTAVQSLNEAVTYRDLTAEATVICAEASTGIASVVVAGMAAPVVVSKLGVSLLSVEGSLLLGADPRVEYRSSTCRIRAGDAWAIATDGTIEAQLRDPLKFGGLGELLLEAGMVEEILRCHLPLACEGILECSRVKCGGKLGDDATIALLGRLMDWRSR